MATENSVISQEQCTRASGKMAKGMAKEDLPMREVSSKESGKMTREQEKESGSSQTEKSYKANIEATSASAGSSASSYN